MMDNKYFNKEMQHKAIKWLEQKWPEYKRVCEVCGNNHWTLAPDLVMPIPFMGAGMTFGGNSYPHVLLTCISCGNAKLFNAVALNIVEGSKDQQNA